MEKWKPINYKGSWHHDPRDELAHRGRVAQENGDTYAAIPLPLLVACANFRECDATTTMKVDYSPEPLTLYCRKMAGHDYDHFNGAISWRQKVTNV